MSDALSIDHRRTRGAEGDGQVKVYALLSVHYYAYDWSNPSIPKALSGLKLQSIFATRLGAEEAQGKLDFPTIIEECEVKQ